jgi:hypothetical protein
VYIEFTKNLPLSCKLHRNSLNLCIKWTKSKCYSNVLREPSLGPTRSLLNVTFSGKVSNTLASVSLLWHIILYRARYYSRNVALPSNLSFHNLISQPSLIDNKPYEKKKFFVPIRPVQKCESPGIQYIRDNAHIHICFLLYHTLSLVRSLKIHLLERLGS